MVREGNVFDSDSTSVKCYCCNLFVGPITVQSKKVNQSHYRPEVPRGFQEVKVPRLHDNGPGSW